MMVVIVEFELRAGAEAEFETALQQMQEQVKQYDGFLGDAPCSSIENENTFVTLFYWRDRESIKAWRNDPQHLEIQHLGREKIFAWYKIRVCELEREYEWEYSE
jgi:heme-degrading monooxygenase HmoA